MFFDPLRSFREPKSLGEVPRRLPSSDDKLKSARELNAVVMAAGWLQRRAAGAPARWLDHLSD